MCEQIDASQPQITPFVIKEQKLPEAFRADKALTRDASVGTKEAKTRRIRIFKVERNGRLTGDKDPFNARQRCQLYALTAAWYDIKSRITADNDPFTLVGIKFVAMLNSITSNVPKADQMDHFI